MLNTQSLREKLQISFGSSSGRYSSGSQSSGSTSTTEGSLNAGGSSAASLLSSLLKKRADDKSGTSVAPMSGVVGLGSMNGLVNGVKNRWGVIGGTPGGGSTGLYAGLSEKSSVLLEARESFNGASIDVERCKRSITRVLSLLGSGAELTVPEASSLFFGATKLFQSRSAALRRLTYLLLQQLPVSPAEAFIVTSALTRDMSSGISAICTAGGANSNVGSGGISVVGCGGGAIGSAGNNSVIGSGGAACCRASAIRALGRVLAEAALAAQTERTLRSALVDSGSTVVQAAALACALRLWLRVPELVRRWSHEISDAALNAPSPSIQALAILLLWRIKATDPLALQKAIANIRPRLHQASIAECLYIRTMVNVVLSYRSTGGTIREGTGLTTTDTLNNLEKKKLVTVLLGYCKISLHGVGSEMVLHEALRALYQLLLSESTVIDGGSRGRMDKSSSLLAGEDISGMVEGLQALLMSGKPIVRYAALRLVNLLCSENAGLVNRCKDHLEALLSDTNRGVAGLALIVLLKTGQESGLEGLMKQLPTVMNEVSDSCRVEVICAIRRLCELYPHCHKLLVGFLATVLREGGSFRFKSEVVDTLISLASCAPTTKETCLLHLCEFIEDCEFPSLASKVLAHLAILAPNTSSPSRYVRFLYNRLILDHTAIRGAALDALVRFGLAVPSLRLNILPLLRLSTVDNDDEIRDRACLYYAALYSLHSNISLPDVPISANIFGDQLHGSLVGRQQNNAIREENENKEEGKKEVDVYRMEEMLSPYLCVSVDAICNEIESIISRNDTDANIDLASLPLESHLLFPSPPSSYEINDNVDMSRSREKGIAKMNDDEGNKYPLGKLNYVNKHEGFIGDIHENELRSTGVVADRDVMDREKVEYLEAALGSVVNLGYCSHTCRAVQVTEAETEYGVRIIKHMFSEHVVLQAYVLNTLNDVVLEDVSVCVTPLLVEPSGSGTCDESGLLPRQQWEILGGTKICRLGFKEEDSCYVVLRKGCRSYESVEELKAVATGIFQMCLRYKLKEEETAMSVYEDEYPLESVTITLGDYMVPCTLTPETFDNQWIEPILQSSEARTQLLLPYGSVVEAAQELTRSMNLAICHEQHMSTGTEGRDGAVSWGISNNTSGEDVTGQRLILHLAGYLHNKAELTVLAKTKFFIESKQGCILQIACRSRNKHIPIAIIRAFE